MRTRARIVVKGVVQGVGFRPYIYRLAHEHGLGGWVLNSGDGVVIDVEGEAVDRFAADIVAKAPPLARVEEVQMTMLPPVGYTEFVIQTSAESAEVEALVPPDIAICPDCRRELFDPGDRRYRYPFINCTNCGPRFTITQGIPYDRPKTTMRVFRMCPQCDTEYHNPLDRRFHAQPNACPECGPSVWLIYKPNVVFASSHAAIEEARRLLREGAIVAIKGLGGFHLACDARSDQAVALLRQRKGREEKPFALMATDLQAVEACCFVSEEERKLLESPAHPIVLLRRRPDAPVSPLVAPGNRYLGMMLPYTPLHHLLLARERGQRGEGAALDEPCSILVMTSGNYSEEPIAIDNQEALERLGPLADAFLLHNRDIYMRCDDSVTRVVEGQEMLIRRARGYVPSAIHLPRPLPAVLAVGAELKNTFCLAKGKRAYVSQHIGDLQNLETLKAFEEAIEHFKLVLRIEPEIVAHDLHPDYLSTQYALALARPQEEGIDAARHTDSQSRPSAIYAVQHHHAHIASCMADNGLEGPVIGVAFDGTGYGTDGTLWGGEFLVCSYADFERWAHLACLPLPGGEAGIRKPYRMALSYLYRAFGCLDQASSFFPSLTGRELEVIGKQVQGALNSPLTSSCGRLFDAVSTLLGIRPVATFEGQAAMELEMAAAEGVEDSYPWSLLADRWPAVIDPVPIVRAVVEDIRKGEEREIIAARFHNSLVDMIVAVCALIGEQTGLQRVCLSGGVFQNTYLLRRVLPRLRSRGLQPFCHRQVPANDGGIALGQAAVAGAKFKGEEPWRSDLRSCLSTTTSTS